jgi:hypothetical protein
MRPLNQLENFLQRVFERPGKALLSQKLHPLELANAVERCLEDQQKPLIGIPAVPNAITLRLNPEDFATFEPVLRALESDLVDRVATLIRTRNYRIVGPIQVHLQSDSGTERGDVAVDGAFLEANMPDLTVVAPIARNQHETVHNTVALRSTARASDRTLRLRYQDSNGAPSTWSLDRLPCTIGRSSQNDIQLPDLRVSRQHARIVKVSDAIEISDLGSSNGTFVNGKKVQSSTVAVGDQISLGGVILHLESNS